MLVVVVAFTPLVLVIPIRLCWEGRRLLPPWRGVIGAVVWRVGWLLLLGLMSGVVVGAEEPDPPRLSALVLIAVVSLRCRLFELGRVLVVRF